jgi:hypothetical protein
MGTRAKLFATRVAFLCSSIFDDADAGHDGTLGVAEYLAALLANS